MTKLPIFSWIGNAAAVLVGGWGAVSRQARTAGCSRQAAYDHARKVELAVRDAAGGGPTRDQLQRQLRDNQTRIAALEKRLAGATEFPEQEQQRFAATATGLSHSQTRALLGIIVKKNVPAARRSRGLRRYAPIRTALHRPASRRTAQTLKYARRDSNPQPSVPKTDALSN
jgi:hypothetical protein